ncbi:riboflavin synthase [Corynebacterium sp. sy017]|uniref:riboflavin synthase n=1 Tax=unclassified Corynebacterium TaxID=2624378 RepID=UPI001186DE50|nr:MULTISPECIES: riboflavin synthase [unclassified Corynebacterium]MBP3087673.1 riboflavin synthase [Corynebacterium sp. sy017]TSD92234.1 riboflavin synthase [Corynebacterium sp. SY003]
MFTGIIEEKALVEHIERLEDALQVRISARTILADAHLGDSISVNGVCLTIAVLDAHSFVVDIMQETLDRTTLGNLQLGDEVNVERALSLQDRLGGHIVQGHVDTTVALLAREHSENWDVLRFELPDDLARYVVEKGSIALNGTSLTVSSVAKNVFEVSLIPTTLAHTTHGQLAVGERVNVEVDLMAKYVEKMLTS